MSVEVFEHGDAGAGDLQEGDGADGEIGKTGVEQLCFFKIDGNLGAGDEVVAGGVAADPLEVVAEGVGVAEVGGGRKGNEAAVGAEIEAGGGGELVGEGGFVDGEGRIIH